MDKACGGFNVKCRNNDPITMLGIMCKNSLAPLAHFSHFGGCTFEKNVAIPFEYLV